MTAELTRRLERRRLASRIDKLLPLELSKETPRLAVTPAPIGKYGLWRVKGMQFPPYFQNVRNALIRNGHSVADASRITFAAIRRWARGQHTGGEHGKIHPEVRTAARKALAGIARDSARAHAQRASHAHTTEADQYVLLEFGRSGRVIEFADPYHAGAGSRQGGQFTSAGNAGGGSPPPSGPTKPSGTQNKPPTISPKQKAAYLKLAATDTQKAQALRAEAAKLNKQIVALTALIAQEQKYLATASTGATSTATGATAAATGTTTTSAATGTSTTSAATGTTTANYSTFVTQQMLAQNQTQLKQLTQTRDQLLQEATKYDQQSAYYTKLANG